MDFLCFCSVLCLLRLCARLFMCFVVNCWERTDSWLSFVVFAVSLSHSNWYPGSVWYLIVSIPDLCTLLT